MKRLRLAIDQMAPVLGDVEANLEKHHDAISWARREKADLLVLPELSLTGYLVRGMIAHVGHAADGPVITELAKSAAPLAMVFGFVEKAPDGQYYNSAAYVSDGVVRAVQRKLFLPNYGMFEEKRFFAPGEHIEPFDTPWGRAGMLICFDMLHPAAAYLHEQAGVRLLITISASPARGVGRDGSMAAGEGFRVAQRAHSRLLGLITVYVNRVGTEEGMTFWGGSEVLDSTAEAICTLPEYEPARAVCEIDVSSVERTRTLFPHLKEGRPDFVLQEMWRLRMGAKVPAPDRMPPR